MSGGSSAADAAVVTGKLAAEYGEMRERIALLEGRLAEAAAESAKKYLSILSLVNQERQHRDVALKIQSLVGKMWDSNGDLAWQKNDHMWLPLRCWLRIASFVSKAEKAKFASSASCFGLPQPALGGDALAERTTFGLIQSSCRIKLGKLSWLVVPDEECVVVGLAFHGSTFEILPALYRPGDEAAARDWADDDGTMISIKCRETQKFLVRGSDLWVRPSQYKDQHIFRLSASFRARNGCQFEALDLKGHFLSFSDRHPSFQGRALAVSPILASGQAAAADQFRIEYYRN